MVNGYCEGKVEYFRLSGKTHKGPYSNAKKVPVIQLGIRDEAGELRDFSVPMNIPNNPFIVRLVESELIGHGAIYNEKYEDRPGGFHGPTWSLKVQSGKFDGLEYFLNETIDW